jgi:uncharacterized protein (DUF433 family)
MHTSHPVFGDRVTSNRLVRGGRWVFRGTIVPLDDVFADLAIGMTLQAVWEKHGALDRRDLDAVMSQTLGEHAHALQERSGNLAAGEGRHEGGMESRRRAAA